MAIAISPKIDRFTGEYEFLSNFFPSPIRMHDGMTYPTVEHAFQAHKTHSLLLRLTISDLSTPNESKRAGRQLELRDDWEDIKDFIMEEALRQKFVTHSELKEKLLATRNAELIEGNTWGDTYWGVCRGKGKNRLGKLLMALRDKLK